MAPCHSLAMIFLFFKATALSQGLAAEPVCSWATVCTSSAWSALAYSPAGESPLGLSALCLWVAPSGWSHRVLCSSFSWHLALWWRLSVHQACEQEDASVSRLMSWLRLAPSRPHSGSPLSSKTPMLALCQDADKGHLILTALKADWIPCYRATVSITDLLSILPGVAGPLRGHARAPREEF